MFATGETMGLAEWIIDDPFLYLFFIFLRGDEEENKMKRK